jgi:hypothetical protein
MQETEHYKLRKPELTDFYNVQDQNNNMDVIDAVLAGKANIQVGGDEPAAGPCLWFDIGGGGSEPDVVSASLELGGPGGTAELIAQVDGVDHPVVNATTGGTPEAGAYNFEII